MVFKVLDDFSPVRKIAPRIGVCSRVLKAVMARSKYMVCLPCATSITYGPHKAVAEVSNHNEPIGRRSGTQLVGKSMDFTFNCFVLN